MATAIANVTLQVTAAPAYISDLAPYAARSLSGAYGPLNGRTTMQSITSANALSMGGTLRGVVNGYSGGGKAYTPDLIVHGGGHGDSANNGFYHFDARGNTRPNGWVEPLEVSPSSAVRNTTGLASGDYTDTLPYTNSGTPPYGAHGRPGSTHTIDGGVYASHNETYYRFGGSPWQAGGSSATCWGYNVAAKQWRRVVDLPGNEGRYCSTIYDPTSRKILVLANDSYNAHFFRCDNEFVVGQGANTAWSPSKVTGLAFGQTIGFYTTGIHNSTTRNGIFIGEGRLNLVTINWEAETIAFTHQPAVTGPTTARSASGPMGWYDPVIDRYTLIGGAGLATFPALHFLNPATREFKSQNLTGATVTADSSCTQHHSRFAFVSAWRAVILLTAHDVAPFVIRLPSVAP